MVARCPPNVTLSPSPFPAPKPWPKKTTFVPTGPLTGSTRILGLNFSGTALLTLYWTGAQQEPSGKGSDEANRTTTSPDLAFAGTSTSMILSFQRWSDHHASNHYIVDSEHRIGITRTSRGAEVRSINLQGVPWLNFCRRDSRNCRLHYCQ